jgi:hypothetical protein
VPLLVQFKAGKGEARTAPLQDRSGTFIVPAYLAAVVLSEHPAADLFDLHMTPLRFLLFAVMIPAVVTLSRRRDIRPCFFDLAIVLTVLWLFVGIWFNNGLDRAVKYGGVLALEALGGYLIARAYIRSPDQFRRMLKAYLALILIAGLLAFPEALFGIKLLSFLGSSAPDPMALVSENPNYRRLGLFRAGVTFDHPILYGAFCATALGMVWYGLTNSRIPWAAISTIVAAAFLSVSSAALLACFAIAAFIAWESLSRPVPSRAALTFWSIAAVAAVVELASTRSLPAVLLPFISLDQGTSYYRLLIWEYVTNNISASPFFGIGLSDWLRPRWMPPSVDCFWLVVAMIGGLPAIGFLTVFILCMLGQVHRRLHREPRERWQMRFAWTAGVIALCLQGFTVHYWGAMNSFFFFLLGSGAWMVDRYKAAVRDDPRPRGLVHRPRFVHSSMLKPRRPPVTVGSIASQSLT